MERPQAAAAHSGRRQPRDEAAGRSAATDGGGGATHPAPPRTPGKPCGSRALGRERSVAWPADETHGPVLLLPSAGGRGGAAGPPPAPLRFNSREPMEVDSPLFAGRLHVFVRGLPSTPPGVFGDGMRRTVWVALQARFSASRSCRSARARGGGRARRACCRRAARRPPPVGCLEELRGSAGHEV
jgi:hypothetical protein